MRWKFPDERDQVEQRQRQAILARIDRWWSEFEKKKDDCDALFRGRKQWDLSEWMTQHLGAVGANLLWEFGPAPEGGHLLVITPENDKRQRPFVEALLARAPQLRGWSFSSYRPALSVESALQVVEAKGGGDLSAVRVQTRRGDNHLVDLAYRSPLYLGEDDDKDFRAALWLTESLVGEETLDHWVGLINTAPVDRGMRLLPLERLKETTDALVQSILDQLPEEPWFRRREEGEWTQWGLRPTAIDNPPGQTDLIAACSLVPEMWVNAHAERSFSSRRFSRCGETFCYLKIDGSRRPDGAEASYRHDLEEAVHDALSRAGVGGAVGGGSGVVYCYIDLALLDVCRASIILRDVLRRQEVPRRSWLLFHDTEYANEWIGMWDDTPAPPRAVEQEEG